MLISKEYRKLNEDLHKSNRNFGAKGWKQVDFVHEKFINAYGLKTLLDYGCGKATLSTALKAKYGLDVDKYDPCVPEYSDHPTKTYQGVICNDMMEHIEPELLDGVFQDIRNLSSLLVYMKIGICPSNKTLADGRNAHLIIESSEWWKERITKAGFVILETLETEKDSTDPKLIFYTVICSKGLPQ